MENMATARTVSFVWAAIFMVLGDQGSAQGLDLGVNWGVLSSRTPAPNIVVQLLKDNGIKKVKMFDADSWTLKAIAGTDMEVMVAIPNDMLSKMAGSYDNAKDWVKENVTAHLGKGGVDIRYVGVGNEPFLTSYNGSFTKTTFPALKNIQKALKAAGHADRVKATIPLNADVYESTSNKPSDGQFRKDMRQLMTDISHFLNDNNSPFVVNIYPFISVYQNPNFPMDFAFMDSNGRTIRDGNKNYDNVLDANHDTLVAALKKAGVPGLKIIIGEVGWPTDGDKNANEKLAKRFYDGLFKKLAKKGGTPLRPGPLDVYLFGLFDEDMKSVEPGFFERHWGIFRYDGQPKFQMDFSGKGQDKLPVAAKGVQYMEKQWCVAKKDIEDLSSATAEIGYACANSDCTSLGYGSSCNNLDAKGNASYAFNMYFQMQDQSVEACKFKSMAETVTEDPSKGSCFFPIQIMSAADSLKLAFGLSLVDALVLSLFNFM